MRSPVHTALLGYIWAFTGIGVFSGFINLLALTGSIYMLQIYDRVLPSKSEQTLVGLTVLMIGLYCVHATFDLLRAKILARIGLRIDRRLRREVFKAVLLLPIRGRPGLDGLKPIRDLDQIRTFLSGVGPTALFDIPWVPAYLFLIFMLHPLFGYLAIAGGLFLVALTLITEWRTNVLTKEIGLAGNTRFSFGEMTRRNAETIQAMGLQDTQTRQWEGLSERYLKAQLASTDVTASLGALSRFVRIVLQSGMLGLGAYLVIKDEATAGVMIAASITLSRALAPLELAIAHWKGFVSARQSFFQLKPILQLVSASHAEVTALPPPEKQLSVEAISASAPGLRAPIIQNIAFDLRAGEGLGIIGPSGSGKSTLARVLVGAWLPLRGAVRLDGAALSQWEPNELGRHIGYLPQDIELFDGTIAENIARFNPEASSNSIIAAAKEAGVHDLIVHLPEGYDTRIFSQAMTLSAGQRQRIALARALYGRPFLVVLDEPNSNLDAEGEAALSQAIASIRARSGIVIVIAHRPSALSNVSHILVLQGGQMQAFGLRDDVLDKIAIFASRVRDGQVQRAANET